MRLLRFIATLPFTAVLHAQSPALDAVAQAMGGKDRLLNARTLSYEGRGTQFNLGQNYVPYTDTTRFEITRFQATMDFANGRGLNDVTREPRFVTAITTPVRARSGVDADVAYSIAATGVWTRQSAQAAIDRRKELLYNPIGFLRAALTPGAVVSEVTKDRERMIQLKVGSRTMTMAYDPRTMLPTRVDDMVDNPMLGDVTVSSGWSDWRAIDGIQVPMHFLQKIDRWTWFDVRFANALVNADLSSLALPDSVRAVPLPPAPAGLTITVEDLAPGVWWIGGGTHHSIAVEQADRIVLIEAPQSEERATAVIARARTLAPNKPVTTVINTHHHFDHAGGLRAAMAQGLEIITHEGNKDFYERYVYGRPHSIAPDALATMTPVQLQITTVSDKRVLNDANHPIEIYTVPGNPHVGTMLIAYLPKEKILVQADMYNPPAANAPPPPSFPFAANLLENVRKRGLQVERVVGIHGRPVAFAEVEAAAMKKP